MIVALHLAATLVVLAAGFAVLSILRRFAAPPAWGEAAALSYLLGLAALAGWMELLDRLSIPVRAPAVLAILTLPAALIVLGRMRRSAGPVFPSSRPLDAFRGRRPWEWLLIALIASKLVYVLVMNVSELLRATDAFRVSLVLAKTMYFEGSRAGFALPEGYPPAPGLVLAWFELLHGRWDEYAVNLAQWNYYAVMLLLFHAGLRRFLSRRLSLAGVYLLSAFPLFLTHAALAGYADLPMALYLTAAGIFLHRYARGGGAHDLRLAVLFSLCLPAVKLEGVTYLPIALFCVAAAVLVRRGSPRPAMIAGAGVLAGALGLAAIFVLEARYGPEGPPALAAVWGNLVPGNRLGQIAGPLVDHFFWGFNNWMVAGTLAALAFPLMALRAGRGNDLPLSLFGGALLATFVYLYGVGGAYLWLVDGTVVNRTFLQILPILLYAVLVFAKPIFDRPGDGAAA